MAGVFNRVQLFDSTKQLLAISDTQTVLNIRITPLVWNKFSVLKQGTTALLEWKTLEEYNTIKFVIERGTNKNDFRKIVAITASGNGNGNNYQYIDTSPVNGVNYYRLRSVDKHNKFAFSEIRSINFSATTEIGIIPNPAKDKITINIPGNSKQVKVYLFNNLGVQLKSYNIYGESAQLNLPDAVPGEYYLKIVGKNIDSKYKLIIQ